MTLAQPDINRFYDELEKRTALAELLGNDERFYRDTRLGREYALLEQLRAFLKDIKGEEADMLRITEFANRLRDLRDRELADRLAVLLVHTWTRAKFAQVKEQLVHDERDWRVWKSNVQLLPNGQVQHNEWAQQLLRWTERLKSEAAWKEGKYIARILNHGNYPAKLIHIMDQLMEKYLKEPLHLDHEVERHMRRIAARRRSALERLEERIGASNDIAKIGGMMDAEFSEDARELMEIRKKLKALAPRMRAALEYVSKVSEQGGPLNEREEAFFYEYMEKISQGLRYQAGLMRRHDELAQKIGDLQGPAAELIKMLEENLRTTHGEKAIPLQMQRAA